MSKMKRLSLLSAFLVLALVLVACGGTEEEPTEAPAAEPTEAPDAEPTEAPTEEPEEMGETGPGTYLARAENGEFDGTEVTVMTVWPPEELESFEAAVAPFEERTGIDIKPEGSDNFESLIVVRTEAGDPPDVAVFPQPGLMADTAAGGHLVDLNQVLDTGQLAQDYSQGLIDLGTVDGALNGILYRASTKSIVFYPKQPFEEAGYEVPETWDEMIALMDQMVANGHTPWCVSIEDSGATGWVATDWVEDIVLRSAGPEVYDQWVNHEIPFNDPQIKEAVEVMGDIWLNPDYVYGGTTGILTTWIGDTPIPMFDEPEPSCFLHRQAGWITAFFPEGVDPETESSFFYLPPIDPAHGSPVLGAGDLVSAFDDRPEVRAFMEYMASAEAAKGWIERGSFISAHGGVPLDWYISDLDRKQAEILQNASVLRFDASDLMPGDVGAGSFWTGMTDYVSGEDLDDVLQAIEDSWPSG